MVRLGPSLLPLSTLADSSIASSSGLKCYVTIFAAESIEACRRACGGHGFSMASGLVQQYADYLPQVTWEGVCPLKFFLYRCQILLFFTGFLHADTANVSSVSHTRCEPANSMRHVQWTICKCSNLSACNRT